METSQIVAYSLTFATLAFMMWFISRQAMKNRAAVVQMHEPKIAGEDELEGTARNPQQFDEPDEEALDQMAKLLGDDDSDDEA